MHVEAVDKGTSKTAKITITNNKGRLSKEEIDRLVEARNGLEAYCVNIKHTLDDSKMQDKFAPGEKESMMTKINEIENWMSNNNSAETEEYEAKQKDLERMFNPIATKLYQGAGGAEAGPRCGNSYQQGQQAGTTSGPHVDEVD